MNVVGVYAKAIVGALVAGLTTAGTALLTPGVTAAEWVTIALAVVTTGGGVWITTNTVTGARVNVTVHRTGKPPVPPDAHP